MWGKLLLPCLLVITMEANAQNNTLLDKITIGKSGAVCTEQGRKCVTMAKCQNKQCVCPAGQKGEGEIECVGSAQHLCTVTGDPHIRAFGEAMATIALPCRFRASRFVTKNLASPSGQGTCAFEVYATNELQHGRYVVRSIHISVGVTEPSKLTHTSEEVYKSVTYSVNDTGIYRYQADIAAKTSIWSGPRGHPEGITVTPGFDDLNNFAILDSPDCETRIKFRAFDRSRAIHQKQLPGLTIQAPRHAQFIEGFGDYPFSCCGTPSDPRSLYRHRADQLNLNNDNTAILYDILAQEPDQTENQLENECRSSFRLFKRSSDRVADVNACAFLLTKPRVGRCIEADHRIPIRVFNACLAVQQNAGWGCWALRRAARVCGGLSDWEGPSESHIQCSRLGQPTTEPPTPKSFVF